MIKSHFTIVHCKSHFSGIKLAFSHFTNKKQVKSQVTKITQITFHMKKIVHFQVSHEKIGANHASCNNPVPPSTGICEKCP